MLVTILYEKRGERLSIEPALSALTQAHSYTCGHRALMVTEGREDQAARITHDARDSSTETYVVLISMPLASSHAHTLA